MRKESVKQNYNYVYHEILQVYTYVVGSSRNSSDGSDNNSRATASLRF